jgi:hypothetical protein
METNGGDEHDFWWSFVDVSQQILDFSKKISKIKIIF